MNAAGSLSGMQDAPRVLLVDDEARLLKGLEALLSGKGFQVKTASNGNLAVDWLRREEFDAVLLDLAMPVMSGHEVMDVITREGIDVAVLVMSGDSSIESAISALRRGARDYVRKPFETEEVLRRLGNVVSNVRLSRENKLISQKLRQSENWHRYLVNNSPDVIYAVDSEGKFVFVNDRVEKLLGYSPEELLGRSYLDLVYEEDLERARYAFNERRTGERASRGIELRLRSRPTGLGEGREPPLLMSVELNASGMYEGSDGAHKRVYVGTYGVIRDISERKKTEEIISFHAFHDGLTGLPNRVLFKDRLSQAIAQAKRNGHMVSVLFLDLDRFKLINDSLGHVVGDELLQEVSNRLRTCLREGDTLARLGGDEFTLLLPEVAGSSDAARVAQKVLAAFELPFSVGQHELYVSVSIGIAMFPTDAESQNVLIKNADIAMYDAKSKGRNTFQFFSHRMNIPLYGRLALEGEIRKALENDEFILHYQPKVELATGRTVGVEALVRWRHPRQGLIMPGEFIPLAEETGLIVPLGNKILEMACRQASAWVRAGIDNLPVAVNISPCQLGQRDFASRFFSILERAGLDGKYVEMEITENVLLKDPEEVISTLRWLNTRGVSISIDDFGTGYASLSYLRKFPFRTVKVDQSFVRDLSSDSGASSIVRAIIAMSKELNLKVVAEGIESPAQLELIRAMGCDHGQGFLLGRAVPSIELEAVHALS